MEVYDAVNPGQEYHSPNIPVSGPTYTKFLSVSIPLLSGSNVIDYNAVNWWYINSGNDTLHAVFIPTSQQYIYTVSIYVLYKY